MTHNDELLIIISQPHAYVSNLSWNLTPGPHSCLLDRLFYLILNYLFAASNRSRLLYKWTRVTYSEVPRIISHVFFLKGENKEVLSRINFNTFQLTTHQPVDLTRVASVHTWKREDASVRRARAIKIECKND